MNGVTSRIKRLGFGSTLKELIPWDESVGCWVAWDTGAVTLVHESEIDWLAGARRAVAFMPLEPPTHPHDA